MSAFTDEQRDELARMVEQAVHDAVAPVARQMTQWVQRERARLADPRRSATGRST